MPGPTVASLPLKPLGLVLAGFETGAVVDLGFLAAVHWVRLLVDHEKDLRRASKNDGEVMFFADPADPDGTRILRLDFEAEGVVEKVGDALQVVERRVQGDLERFKEFIEKRGTATGGWRGEIRPTAEVRK